MKLQESVFQTLGNIWISGSVLVMTFKIRENCRAAAAAVVTSNDWKTFCCNGMDEILSPH